jgi:PAS domain S-box-containing protein
MAHALRGDAVSDAEIFVRNPGVPDGRMIEVTARPLRDESGQLNGALAVFRDITGRKRLEDAARQLRSTFDSALDSVVTMDDQGRIMDWNPTAEVMFGWPKSEVVGRTMAETIIPERYRGAHANGVRDAAGTGAGPVIGRRTEIEAVHRDGHEFTVELSIAATRSENRYIFIGFIRDITERQRAEETRRRLAAVVDSSAESIYTLDLTGAITSWNPAAEELLGYTGAEILGKHGRVLAAPGTTGDMAPTLLKGERVAPHQIQVLTKDGRRVTVSASISPLKDGAGRTAGAAVVLRDETDRQRRAAIIESVLENIGDGVVIADEQGARSYNAEANRILGMDIAGVLEDEWAQRYAVYRADQKTPYPAHEFPLAKALRGEALDETDIFVRHPEAPDGIFVTISARPLRGPGGEALGAVAILRDVSARRRSQEVQRQLAAVVQSSDDAIYAVSAEGLVTAWNPGAERLLGWSAQEVIGRDPWAATRKPAETERRQNLLRAEPTHAFDTEVPGKDGRRIPVLASVSQMKDAAGQVVGVAVILRDMSESRHALETRLRLAAIVESSDDAIVAEDLDGGILSWNAGAERLYGYSAEEAEGKNVSILVPSDRTNELPGLLERISQGMGIEHFETVRVRKDGTRLDVSITISPLRDLSGTVVGVSAITRDISKQKRADEEIRKLNAGLEQRIAERTAALEASNQELEAFSYSVSHDLRAPLRAVNGFVQLLVQTHAAQLSPDARRYLDRVAAGARQMGQLIDDLLAFSRLGRTPLEKRNLAAGEVVERALEQLRPQLEGRAVELSVGDLPICACEPALLEQVFVNLIGNALKYSRGREPARIEVSARVDPVSKETVFAVRDNGVGFDMQYADKLFGVFQRLHRAEDYEGTGVGLAIVQRIVHRHGGRVWAQAEPEKGATFYFTLGGTIEWLPAAA